MKIGCMLWRIGDILDFYDQLDWVKANRFEEVSFWTIPGSFGHWQGFDAEQASKNDIFALKNALYDLSEVDLHAGFPLNSMDEDSRNETLQRLIPTFELAGNIGASTITIHPDSMTNKVSGEMREIGLTSSLIQINDLGKRYNTMVGIETEWDMPLIERLDLPNVGITIDTGHLHFDNGKAFEPYGSLGGMIKRFYKKIIHLHLHDYDGQLDHIAIGRGNIDFADIIEALCAVQFGGSLCLEINPDREPPEAICRSRDYLREMITDLML